MGKYVLTGDIIYPDGPGSGTIGIIDGSIEYFDGDEVVTSAEGELIEGTIYPGLIDMHTHLADHGARGPLPAELSDVMFPGGLKHRFLEGSKRSKIISSLRSSMLELSPGITQVLDYREGGMVGARLLEEAILEGMPLVHCLGRISYKGEDIDELLRITAGLGLPSLSSTTIETRDRCRQLRKIYSFHASELFREDIDPIMAMVPDLVIHMVSGTKDDWRTMAEGGIPIAVCPRANRTYNIKVPLGRMMEEGSMIGLGTDNALSVKQDMFREMEEAWLLLREIGMEGRTAAEEVFSMAAGISVAKSGLYGLLPSWTGWWKKGWPMKDETAHLFVKKGRIDEMSSDPLSEIVRFTGQKDILWTGPGT